MYQIKLSTRFIKSSFKLASKDPTLKKKLTKFLSLVRINPHHPSLRIHKLINQPHWSFSIDIKYRVIANIENNTILLTNIGSHDEVY